MKNMFTIENLFFKFSHQAPLFFEQDNLSFEAGSIYVITGKNGVGKSTLFRLFQGIVKKDEVFKGQFTFGNQKFNCTTAEERNKLAQSGLIRVVPQQVQLMFAENFTVRDHLALAHVSRYPTIKPVPYTTQVDLLAQASISLDTLVENLSGGQRQILATAIMLIYPCKVLLLDEPTANLDKENATFVLQVIAKFAQQKNIMVIIISHDQEFISLHDPSKIFCIVKKDDAPRKIIPGCS